MSTQPATGKVINIHQLKTVCSSCSLRELCLPMGLSHEEIEHLDSLVYTRKRVKRGENLYGAGDGFNSLYAVRSGFFKTNVILEDGRDLGAVVRHLVEIDRAERLAERIHLLEVRAHGLSSLPTGWPCDSRADRAR